MKNIIEWIKRIFYKDEKELDIAALIETMKVFTIGASIIKINKNE